MRSGLKTDERFELMMLSQSIFENLEPVPKAADELNYDDQVYEDVNGYESLRKILKYKSLIFEHEDLILNSLSNPCKESSSTSIFSKFCLVSIIFSSKNFRLISPF